MTLRSKVTPPWVPLVRTMLSPLSVTKVISMPWEYVRAGMRMKKRAVSPAFTSSPSSPQLSVITFSLPLTTATGEAPELTVTSPATAAPLLSRNSTFFRTTSFSNVWPIFRMDRVLRNDTPPVALPLPTIRLAAGSGWGTPLPLEYFWVAGSVIVTLPPLTTAFCCQGEKAMRSPEGTAASLRKTAVFPSLWISDALTEKSRTWPPGPATPI